MRELDRRSFLTAAGGIAGAGLLGRTLLVRGEVTEVRSTRLMMGTLVTVTAVTRDPDRAELGVERAFAEMAEADPTAFYLTDFLVRHFDRLVIESLGIDRHPELIPMYFGNYTKMVYLAQSDDPALQAKARAAAERLGLAYAYRFAGYGELETFLKRAD